MLNNGIVFASLLRRLLLLFGKLFFCEKKMKTLDVVKYANLKRNSTKKIVKWTFLRIDLLQINQTNCTLFSRKNCQKRVNFSWFDLTENMLQKWNEKCWNKNLICISTNFTKNSMWQKLFSILRAYFSTNTKTWYLSSCSFLD